ncbi:sunset domain-containing protein [Escherichia sp. SP-MK]
MWAEKDGWLNLGGDQWIKSDPSYVKSNKKSTVDSSVVGKRVVSKVNNLQFYDKTNAEETFCSEADAKAAGYRASKK